MTPTSPEQTQEQIRGAEIASLDSSPAWLGELGWLVGRSLFPIVALLLIWGTVVWGPYVTLVLTLVWWRIVTHIG